MPTKEELEDAIEKYSNEEVCLENCKRLAVFHYLLDKVYGNEPQPVSINGSSEFMEVASRIKSDHLFKVLDELMDTLQVLNPKLYTSVMKKLEE